MLIFGICICSSCYEIVWKPTMNVSCSEVLSVAWYILFLCAKEPHCCPEIWKRINEPHFCTVTCFMITMNTQTAVYFDSFTPLCCPKCQMHQIWVHPLNLTENSPPKCNIFHCVCITFHKNSCSQLLSEPFSKMNLYIQPNIKDLHMIQWALNLEVEHWKTHRNHVDYRIKPYSYLKC